MSSNRRGFYYPLNFVNLSVGFGSDQIALVDGLIRTAIATAQDERPYSPNFGRNLEPFDNVRDIGAILKDLRRAIDLALTDYDVRYALQGEINDDGQLMIRVNYGIMPENDENTLVTRYG